MKSTIFRYGIYAALTILILSAVHFFLVMPNTTYGETEIAGYLTMLISMVFVFLGIKHYRDHVNNGSLSFGQGLKLGLLIALIPAIFFGLFNVLYVEVIDPGWQDEYYRHYVENVKATASADELPSKLNELEKQKEFFSNPVMTFLVMTATVLVIGVIVAIISSLALRRAGNRTEA